MGRLNLHLHVIRRILKFFFEEQGREEELQGREQGRRITRLSVLLSWLSRKNVFQVTLPKRFLSFSG